MFYRFFAVCLILISINPAAFSADTSSNLIDLTGEYTCDGINPYNNNPYTNNISIKKMGDTYLIRWSDKNGYPIAYGTGIYDTDLKDWFAVIYRNLTERQGSGIILYKIKADGTLMGKWVVKGTTKIGTDNCKKR